MFRIPLLARFFLGKTSSFQVKQKQKSPFFLLECLILHLKVWQGVTLLQCNLSQSTCAPKAHTHTYDTLSQTVTSCWQEHRECTVTMVTSKMTPQEGWWDTLELPMLLFYTLTGWENDMMAGLTKKNVVVFDYSQPCGHDSLSNCYFFTAPSLTACQCCLCLTDAVSCFLTTKKVYPVVNVWRLHRPIFCKFWNDSVE